MERLGLRVGELGATRFAALDAGTPARSVGAGRDEGGEDEDDEGERRPHHGVWLCWGRGWASVEKRGHRALPCQGPRT